MIAPFADRGKSAAIATGFGVILCNKIALCGNPALSFFINLLSNDKK